MIAFVAFAGPILAISLASEPVTPVGDVTILNENHPAHGAALPNVLSSDGPMSGNPRRRDLAGMSNENIRRLERHYGEKMVRNVAQLVTKSAFTPTPWPGSYWPVYQDGINVQYANEPSASEKYATAFGLNVTAFMNNISKKSGILGQSGNKKCTKRADCSSLNDGSVCAKRAGESTGVCIPTWFGICHAWAPAAFMEPEPKCPVTMNNVTFGLMDIKGLITQFYDDAGISTVFTGSRFNGPNESEDNKDEFGRFRDASRRDLGPAYFHIAIANIMGRFKDGFVVDVDAGAEVWNQPAYGYEFLEQYKMTPEDATKLYINSTMTEYPFNPRAKNIMYVKNKFEWIVEGSSETPFVSSGQVSEFIQNAELEYLLELDAFDDIIGGEWIGESKEKHPDFLWMPAERPSMDKVTAVGLEYRDIKKLLDASIAGSC